MEKSLFPYTATICNNWKNMPPLLRREYSTMFQRPDNPQSWWYKAGLPLKFNTTHFKFHYTGTGPDAVLSEDISPLNGVPDLVDICAASFEKSYQALVSQLGYRVPYDDFWTKDNGGDERYDVYLFSGPWLGFTMAEYPIITAQSTAIVTPAYFGVNSRTYEFVGASEGKRYLETTCAHEFFHSVEYAYNIYSPLWFMEACSTWAEHTVYDGSEQGETDGSNYYRSQLIYWFQHPDWSLTMSDGWHEYGNVIWSIFLTEKYDPDIIRDVYETMAEGSYRELADFYDAFENRGTNLGAVFKEFTLWNYFTGNRYDKRFYSQGYKYPAVPIHLDNIHEKYPTRVDLDSEKAPEHLGARYIRFLPATGQETLSIKVNGSDVTKSDDLQSLSVWGTRGWGAKLVIYQRGRSPKTDEIFLFPRSQEGQRNFTNFGTEIEEVVLILSNLHPDLDVSGVSYSAGQQPAGRLSEPRLSRNDKGEVMVTWEPLDLSGIKEIAIVRKRFAPSEGDQDDTDIQVSEVYRAPDADNNGIPDENIDIVGKVAATDTVFVDKTTFMDVTTEQMGFDPQAVHYYYAVVPVSEYGIMGTPAISKGGITPVFSQPLEMVITTQPLAPGEWEVVLHTSQPLREPPELASIAPDGRRIPIKLSADNDQAWRGRLLLDVFSPTGIYTFVVSAKGRSGIVSTIIAEGGQFRYVNDAENQEVVCYPNPFRPGAGNLKFRPPGFQIKIYSVAGELVRELSSEESEWDGTNEKYQPVASGTYIYCAVSGEIERKGKIAVIR